MALQGVKVLEFVGLAPGPFCGKILSDFGATVTRIDKVVVKKRRKVLIVSSQVYNNPLDCLAKGKRTLATNIKDSKSQQLIKQLCRHYDVLIEPFRPGVLEKHHLGPSDLMKENPGLIYARLTGFGQNGPLAARAGHDINYVALSGVLSYLGRKNENPSAPINLLADFAGGGLLCALGICLALLEKRKSGKGQVVDSSMVEGAAYIGSWLTASRELPIWGNPRGENILDGGAFYYDTYKTKDGKYMSVGALEPQFYDVFIKTLGLDIPQFEKNEVARKRVTEVFLTKTQKEWSQIFEKLDACVFPVLDWTNASEHSHNKTRQSFVQTESKLPLPIPAPRLSRTPGKIRNDYVQDPYAIAVIILKEIGKTDDEIKTLCDEGIVILPNKGKL